MWRLLIFVFTGHWPKSRVVTASGRALTELSDRVDELERQLRTTRKKLHTLEGHYYSEMGEDDDEPPAPATPAPGTNGDTLPVPGIPRDDFPEDAFQEQLSRRSRLLGG